jgi:hypothetical protein
MTEQQLDRLENDFSLETWNAIKAENAEPLNCTADAATTIEASKQRAEHDEIIRRANSAKGRKDRDFLMARAALLRARMANPRLSTFVDEIGIAARNNPALVAFAHMLSAHAR